MKAELNKDEIRFIGKVTRIAKERFGASCEGRDAEPFVNMLYEEYCLSDQSTDAEEWIESRLIGEFLYISEPPRWIEEEPKSPFVDCKPMVFISQTTLPRNKITERCLSWDSEIFIFGARIPYGSGYKVEYKVIEQFNGVDGSGSR